MTTTLTANYQVRRDRQSDMLPDINNSSAATANPQLEWEYQDLLHRFFALFPDRPSDVAAEDLQTTLTELRGYLLI